VQNVQNEYKLSISLPIWCFFLASSGKSSCLLCLFSLAKSKAVLLEQSPRIFFDLASLTSVVK
jgi:hypothetical protein